MTDEASTVTRALPWRMRLSAVLAAFGDVVRNGRAIPGLGRIAKNDGYSYRYATQNKVRGPNWRS